MHSITNSATLQSYVLVLSLQNAVLSMKAIQPTQMTVLKNIAFSIINWHWIHHQPMLSFLNSDSYWLRQDLRTTAQPSSQPRRPGTEVIFVTINKQQFTSQRCTVQMETISGVSSSICKLRSVFKHVHTSEQKLHTRNCILHRTCKKTSAAQSIHFQQQQSSWTREQC